MTTSMPQATRRLAASETEYLLRSPAAEAVRLGDFAQTSSGLNPLDPFDGERKIVTVLFADIVRSSLLISRKDPEDANEVILSILQIMIDCVHRFEGTVTQILGDGIMAVFGVPVAQEDHAFRACLAAQAIQTTIGQSFDAKSLPPDRPIAVRVGLSSGEVLMQTVENDLSSEYRLAGEAVYLAARMERIAGPGTVLLGEDTLRLAANWVKATPVTRVSLAAESRSVMIFELAEITREKPIPRDRAPLPRAAFVGREDDLRLIHDALEDADFGTG